MYNLLTTGSMKCLKGSYSDWSVCLSVCLFVCLSVCLCVRTHYNFRTHWPIWTKFGIHIPWPIRTFPIDFQSCISTLTGRMGVGVFEVVVVTKSSKNFIVLIDRGVQDDHFLPRHHGSNRSPGGRVGRRSWGSPVVKKFYAINRWGRSIWDPKTLYNGQICIHICYFCINHSSGSYVLKVTPY